MLRNPGAPLPWYPLEYGETLVTPEWTFSRSELRRFALLASERSP